jgi:hypothetical protein
MTEEVVELGGVAAVVLPGSVPPVCRFLRFVSSEVLGAGPVVNAALVLGTSETAVVGGGCAAVVAGTKVEPAVVIAEVVKAAVVALLVVLLKGPVVLVLLRITIGIRVMLTELPLNPSTSNLIGKPTPKTRTPIKRKRKELQPIKKRGIGVFDCALAAKTKKPIIRIMEIIIIAIVPS